ncbi:MAG: hypothetical protein H7831_18935, partial [Magnetococcus sp. WYHC-3]
CLAAFQDCMNLPDQPTFLQWWDPTSLDHVLARGLRPQGGRGEILNREFRSDHAAIRVRLQSADLAEASITPPLSFPSDSVPPLGDPVTV